MTITTQESIETTHEVKEYGKVILIISRTTSIHEENTTHYTGFRIVRISFYNKMCRKHGKEWTKNMLHSIPMCERLGVVTERYWKHYQEESCWSFEGEQTEITSLKGVQKVLESGDFKRVVHDALWFNGLFYDVDGKPVWRPIAVDYINGHICSKVSCSDYEDSYKIAEVIKHLSKHPKVRDAVVVEVPDYNGGGEAVQFWYLASPREFQRMALSGYRDLVKNPGDPVGGIGTYEHFDHIRKQLRLSQFKEWQI